MSKDKKSVVRYPKAYIDKLVEEGNETMEKVRQGEWPVFDNVEDMVRFMEAE